ncbi:RabGAP/TBC, partial [Ascobolus immersus RN42]
PRSKSWSDAMSELGQDAKELTEALEEFSLSQEGEGHTNKPLPPPAPRPHTITLPPLQGPSPIIDPLPISKEKASVLSRTRPSWLPPKNPSEEKRHLREYKRMMAAAAETERRKRARAVAAAEAEERRLEELTHLWHSRVLPNFAEARAREGTREMWWRGIPRQVRGTVWARAIGNGMCVSESTFAVALNSARQLEQSLVNANSVQTDRDRAVFGLIRRDVAALSAEYEDISLSRGYEPGAFGKRLGEVLYAYAWYRRDVGYIHGIHGIAGLLLLNMNKIDAFIALANILNTPLPLAFLTNDAVALAKIYHETAELLRYKYGRLHTHLTKTLGLQNEAWLEPLMSSCLTRRLPVEVQERLWDVLVFEGGAFLVRATVGVVGMLEGRLYGGREEVEGGLGWG